MAKIKQTIRRKGKRENNVSDGGEKKSILFFEENSESEWYIYYPFEVKLLNYHLLSHDQERRR